MSFDAHSLERLKALGRSLPKPLPAPERQPTPPVRQHRLETEQNPEQLFRELMTASADGTVPAHLLDRLRQLEAVSPRVPRETSSPPPQPSPSNRRPSQRRAPAAPADQELYEAFADLLSLEQEEAEPLPTDRRSDGRSVLPPVVRPQRRQQA